MCSDDGEVSWRAPLLAVAVLGPFPTLKHSGARSPTLAESTTRGGRLTGQPLAQLVSLHSPRSLCEELSAYSAASAVFTTVRNLYHLLGWGKHSQLSAQIKASPRFHCLNFALLPTLLTQCGSLQLLASYHCNSVLAQLQSELCSISHNSCEKHKEGHSSGYTL